MASRLTVIAILASALLAGAALYWLQIYAFYYEVTSEEAGGITLLSLDTRAPEPIEIDAFRGIDSDSSPIRFRACFTTPLDPAFLAEGHVVAADANPLVAPPWFDCFDAEAIGTAIEAGEATVFVGQANIVPGIDRVVAIFPDGRGYAWHQLNGTLE